MSKQDDGLFLLEVLIDKIVFVKSPCFSDKDFRTCVNIECPAVEPLEICDDDQGVCIAKSVGPFVKTFNSGKSCLFSLKDSEISSAMSKFPIKISVFKSLPCGCLPNKIVMGEATIDMTKEFVEARKKFLADPTAVSYQALKDSFRINGPDGSETGEVVMFLRISCFGKLIVTRFQGGGGPPSLDASSGGYTIVDRSCNPRREFQTSQEPCVCGATRSGTGSGTGKSGAPPCIMGGGSGRGLGVCSPARDPYNSRPCEDPDDPCYCTGPKQPLKDNLACRNTDRYCLHVPKGQPQNLPFVEELNEDQKHNIKIMSEQLKNIDHHISNKNNDAMSTSTAKYYLNNYCNMSIPQITPNLFLNSDTSSFMSFNDGKNSIPSLTNFNKMSLSYSYLKNNHDSKCNLFINNDLLVQKTDVYMTLLDDFCYHQGHRSRTTAGSQATASINKCLQVCYSNSNSNTNTDYTATNLSTNSQYLSSCTMSTIRCPETKKLEQIRYSDIYFFGRKRDKQGMGNSEKAHKYKHTSTNSVSSASKTAQTKQYCNDACVKTVSIKEYKSCPTNRPCPVIGSTLKGDMMATVSHIKFGPRELCPVHGKEPCQGPKCIIAASGGEQTPVKVTTMSNPRRGVFELVIRRINGAPLAKNELMLEWTPPSARPPCGIPCSIPCATSVSCRPSKCKMIVCRPSPCKPKGCRKPCGPSCRSVPCSTCCKILCRKPCHPCKPSMPVCRSCRLRRPCKPCSPCRPCTRPCPPPRKIFKRPCLPRCRPCSPCKPCSPCPPSPCSNCCSTPPLCRPFPPPPCKSCKKSRPFPPPPCKSCRKCRPCFPLLRKPCKRPKRIPCQPCRSCCPTTSCSPCRLTSPTCSTTPCCNTSCANPCKSLPCLRSCPVSRKKTRKSKSHPKIRAHRKRISPCFNRSKLCPIVRCRSVPGPCMACCGPIRCPIRKCCSIAPCKPLKCCKSTCFICCD